MDQNKKKIRYILQYFDKHANALKACEKKSVLFMTKVLFKNQQHANGSFVFVSEISMLKMGSVLMTDIRDQIVKKIERNRYISSHDIANELNILVQNVLNHL